MKQFEGPKLSDMMLEKHNAIRSIVYYVMSALHLSLVVG